MNRRTGVAFLVAALIMVLPVRAAPESGGLSIVVSIPPQKFLAQWIGGERMNVRIMLEPGHAPETFEPTPRQMAAVSGANFYFSIGVPFENAWLPEIQQQNPELRLIECCSQFAAASREHGGHDDPHIWVSPTQFLSAAERIYTALLSRDSGNSALYQKRYQALNAQLTMLNRDLRNVLKDRRINEFIISHGALGPLAEEYGLIQIALDSGGREVGPKTLAEITLLARRQNIRTVFVLKQHNQGPARTLARELDAELVEIDPLAENYLDNMRAIGRLLAAATL